MTTAPMTTATMTAVAHVHHDSPIGPLLLAASERGLRALYMREQKHVAPEPRPGWRPLAHATSAQRAIVDRTRRQLDAYFDGERSTFDLPLDVVGTAFQRRVWDGLCGIDYAATISYGELARRIGQPTAVRAVGLANGRNPVSIVVPCHRVIGADGSMTGYGGGLERKIFLLALEARIAGRSTPVQASLPGLGSSGSRPPNAVSRGRGF